jgi:hypothetical protein
MAEMAEGHVGTYDLPLAIAGSIEGPTVRAVSTIRNSRPRT